ncbi:MAG: VIT domain-containing protein [Verrucomicrobiota bacterium]|nr:VIT domain-containing protein [Verrucomicrobiota bacterium]
MKRSVFAACGITLALTLQCLATGMLVPKDAGVSPLAIKRQRVDIQLKEGAANVKVEQVFKNNVDRDLEAVYVFPLPENAGIADFAMYIGGKRVSGELVEKGKARQIYQDIVRRMKDPGLLEHLSGNLFRVNIYPMPKNGEQRIEIAYSQNLAFEGGLYSFVYPLKTSEKASRTLEDFTVNARLVSSVPLKTVYSPSHKVGITRRGDHEAVIGFEEDKSVLDRDFVLYYGFSKKDFGLNLLTHRIEGQDGFFMMLLAPAVEPPKGEVIKRDLSFVFDTSGSMSGDKIRQAREALKYCVNRLKDYDRFNIIRFSTDVEKFSEGFLAANDKNRKAALEFVDKIEARGGTDIAGALAAALGQKTEETRPHVIVFLTDGLPTIGVTEIPAILDNVGKAIGKNTRVFVFGVGHNVNTHLLDRLANERGGVSQYVQPEEDIEVKVSSLYDKISHPVLSRPEVKIEKVEVSQLHPKELSDLFAGSQITIFGRYKSDGHVAIRLAGEVNGKKQEHTFEADFPAKSMENDFIPQLWATRRVGYLLDQIRLKEDNELRDEVIRLGKEYGIVTPYTSYLVLETHDDYKRHGLDMGGPAGQPSPRPAIAPPAREEVRERAAMHWSEGLRRDKDVDGMRAPAAPAAKPESSSAIPMFGGAGEAGVAGAKTGGHVAAEKKKLDGYLKQQSGRDAVVLSNAIGVYKKAEHTDRDIAPAVKTVGRKIFYLLDGVWTDRDYKKEMKATRVKYASDEYFKLLEKKPELKKCFALGEEVIVVLDDQTAVIVETAE